MKKKRVKYFYILVNRGTTQPVSLNPQLPIFWYYNPAKKSADNIGADILRINQNDFQMFLNKQ